MPCGWWERLWALVAASGGGENQTGYRPLPAFEVPPNFSSGCGFRRRPPQTAPATERELLGGNMGAVQKAAASPVSPGPAAGGGYKGVVRGQTRRLRSAADAKAK
jgi:hypothetical protein